MDDPYLLISADGHAGPPAEHYREYLDPAFREAFDAHQAEVTALREEMLRQSAAFRAAWEAKTGDGGLTAAYDSDARNEKLDGEGVAAEVLFPDADVLGTGRLAASPFGSGLGSPVPASPQQVLAGARAHNRWLADFCAQDPHRRIGVAVVPITADVDGAVEEIREVAELGLRGIMIPTRWFEQPAYHEPVYEPVWRAVEDLGLVLHTHSGAGPADYGEGPGSMAIYATEAYWWAARPLWVLLWSGVFERHPGLRYVIAENGAWWVPDLVRKMDEKYLGGHNTKKMGNVFTEHLRMKPSEYIDRSCFFAASTPGVEDIARREEIGVGNILWGNDFPHPEGTFPHTRELVRLRFHDLPEDQVRRMLGLTAAGLYGVDTAALAPLVERIGPRRDEVHRSEPLEVIPRVTELGELPVGFPMPRDVERLQDESARVRLPRPPGRRYPFPVPNGWFAVATSEELPAGGILARAYFARSLVVFRTEHGATRVTDAHCPHLGAHLGVGGRVEGDCIRCPFHGWRFDGESGACVEIPYGGADRIPAKAAVRSFPTIERNGLVWAWHHLLGGAPFYDVPVVPEFEDPAWLPVEIRDFRVNVAAEDMAENNVDYAHFAYVHGTDAIPEDEFVVDGTYKRTVGRGGTFVREGFGLGLGVVRTEGFMTFLSSTTPLDEERVHVRWVFTAPRVNGPDAAREAADLLLAGVSQDIPIWENKVYREHPVLTRSERPILEQRQWARQFYSDPADR